ncbi:MAG: hypothetical protein QQW96_16485 [Tychonema bourrellyi B0820]|uniref:Uncharacterized protein n=1 Tax=Tychonema bourrellyi FEM_GT703 TaxID=2040638 RepID=A0A2G4F1A1_9CYAN|nr:hypothetical protein [Tychonema bourrellyi]MDQ2099227.1 hypothetical protein [Tychonema bourrellyi B0820]PHX55554.1 hypothetical protein CP500_010230 [Tychonema bourrellyi FEM_GT703]
MPETKDTSLFTEITAQESASVNGAHRYRDISSRSNCNNYSYSPYFDGRPTYGYIQNVSYRRYYYYN